MVKNFEEFTNELSEAEMMLLPALVRGLELRNSDNPIKAPEIVAGMNIYAERHGMVKMTDARLRKMVNYLRSCSLLPVIATSKGYYVSYDVGELSDQIKSLTERANSIFDTVNGLKKILKKIEKT